MGRFIQTVSTFHKGDWGDLGAFKAGQAEDGYFKALNMIVYRDGSIGPRPGLKQRAYTSMPNGSVLLAGFEVQFALGTQRLFFVIDNDLYTAPAAGDGAVATIGAFSGGAPSEYSQHGFEHADNHIWLALSGSGIYHWDRDLDTITQVATPASSEMRDIHLHRDRMYVAARLPNRVYYSDAADFDTWGATSYFLAGYESGTLALNTIGNNLSIMYETTEWMASGVPESTFTLREMNPSGGFGRSAYGQVKVPQERAWYWIPDQRNAPVISTGGIEDRQRLVHLEDWRTVSAGVGGAHLPTQRDILFVDSTAKGLWRHNDVWTRHAFQVGVDFRVFALDPYSNFCLVEDGDVSNPPSFYVLRGAFTSGKVHRPAFVSDDDAQPGDDSTTPFTAYLYLPEWWHPQTKDVRVQAVDVDFVSWDTGTAATAHFDVTVEALRTPGGQWSAATSGGNDSVSQEFDEAVASSSTTGDERRMRFNFGGQGWGRGYQVRFTNIRSVAIRSVSVVVDDEPRDAR